MVFGNSLLMLLMALLAIPQRHWLFFHTWLYSLSDFNYSDYHLIHQNTLF